MEVGYEIRDGRLHLSGYVNAVERDSKVIMTLDGRCVEQIAAGAFAASLADGHEVRMRLNHERDLGSTKDGTITELKEDKIGLYVEAVTDDEEIRSLAEQGRLTGWSFTFVKKDGTIEKRGGDVPRRRIKALDLTEVSVLSITPAYDGTLVECRANGEETRSYKDYDTEKVSDVPENAPGQGKEETRDDTSADDTGKEEKPVQKDSIRGRVQCFLMNEKIKQLKAEQRSMETRAKVQWAKETQAELEERYNHYHDPRNGRFASGKGGGMGLYYSMGKGKGEVVGASSPWQPKKSNHTAADSERIKNQIINSASKLPGIQRKIKSGEGNWSWVKDRALSESEAQNMKVEKVLEKGDYSIVSGTMGTDSVFFAAKNSNATVTKAKETMSKRKAKVIEATQKTDITARTTSTYDRWYKNNRKNFANWYYGSNGG